MVNLAQIEIGEHVDLFFEGDGKWYQGEVINLDDGQITIREYVISTVENYTPRAEVVKYQRDYTFNFDDILASARINMVIE